MFLNFHFWLNFSFNVFNVSTRIGSFMSGHIFGRNCYIILIVVVLVKKNALNDDLVVDVCCYTDGEFIANLRVLVAGPLL